MQLIDVGTISKDQHYTILTHCNVHILGSFFALISVIACNPVCDL